MCVCVLQIYVHLLQHVQTNKPMAPTVNSTVEIDTASIGMHPAIYRQETVINLDVDQDGRRSTVQPVMDWISLCVFVWGGIFCYYALQGQ